MVEIIPAIMPHDREDIEHSVARYIETPIQTIQLDLMDGEFTSTKTWPYRIKNQFQEYTILEEEGFPGWQDIDIELDLMVANPLEDIKKFIEFGPSRIIIHAKSVSQDALKHFLQEHARVQSFIHFGIALTTEDAVEDFSEILSLVDFVQCMGIREIGVQGSPLEEGVFDLIQKIKTLYPQLPISVDGGVSPHNAQRLIDAGVERLVSGSFLGSSLDVVEAIQLLGGNIEE